MRVLILDSYYDRALSAFYDARPGLSRAPHDEQLAALLAFSFGTADYYSRGLRALGHEATETVVNAAPLQQAWAREHGVRRRLLGTEGAWLRRVVLERVRRERPDVLYVQDVTWPDALLLRELKAYTRVIAGQVAYPLPPDCDLRGFDVVFSSLPHFVRMLRREGVAAEPLRIGFAPVVLERLGAVGERSGAVFVGSFGGHHAGATRLLERVAELVPIELWGPGVDGLPPRSPIRPRHRGEAWGIDMYRVIARAAIVVNRHIDIAGRYANNMRLFEATGVGALLITEAKENLPELFAPGVEVVTYRHGDAHDLAERIRYYLANDQERQSIARAGQARTLREHTYDDRMRELADALERYAARCPAPRAPGRAWSLVNQGRMVARDARAAVAASPLSAPLRPIVRAARLARAARHSVSRGHRLIAADLRRPDLERAWTAPEIASHQRRIVDAELARTYRGHPPAVFSVAAEALRGVLEGDERVVEVGCASGYYAEALAHLLGRRIRYVGLDLSPALLRQARAADPPLAVAVADATQLPLRDGGADILLSGGVLLHISAWRRAVAESARVGKTACIFHRTPVIAGPRTLTMTKLAYGVEVLEHAFSRAELEACFEEAGLVVADRLVVERGHMPAVGTFEVVTYVCRRPTAR